MPVRAGVPQGSILGPLLFLVCINDLLIGIESNARIFADDTSLFKIATNNHESTSVLNNDLVKITQWANQWKMIFNPDESKQAVEIVFSSKYNPTSFDDLVFHGVGVRKVNETKHIGLVLNEKLSFQSHIDSKISKARQGVGLMKCIYPYVPRFTLELVFKLNVRPHLDYADIIFHIPYKDNPAFLSEDTDESLNSLMQKIESVQYDAALSSTGAWRGSPRKELYEDLGWESLHLRREARRLCMYHEIITFKKPKYLYNVILERMPSSRSRGINANNVRSFHHRTESLALSFFPSTTEKWNSLEVSTKNLVLKSSFKNEMLKRIRPKRKEMFGINDRDGQKWIAQLRVRLSPLNAHKFHHNFEDTLTPMCNIHDGIDDTFHFLLHCRQFSIIRIDLLQNLSLLLSNNVSVIPDNSLVHILLYGKENLSHRVNKQILLNTIDFIRKSNRL